MTASELVESAIIFGKEAEATAAARQLAVEAYGATDLVRQQALNLLARAEKRTVVQMPVSPSEWRARSRQNPYDALAWVEVALGRELIKLVLRSKR